MELDKNYAPQDGTKSNPGPFLARVVNNNDPTYMGILEVEILRPAGSDNSPAVFQQVKYLNPFYGVTALANNGKDPNNYGNTQKSYGMWMVPPDVGQTVVVIYINGNPKYAYWIGCVMDDEMNFMLPGQAATQQVVEGEGRLPVGEYNKLLNERIGDPEQVKKPASPLADVLTAQGLIKDDIRGITTSSARRESPSNVYGISTPGPLDKRSGAKKSLVGKPGSQVNTWVSRLGGHTFVMDDGDANFVRKGPASDSPPEYAAVEQGEDGDPTIPHNELIRIRTRTGHQILLHNSEDLIYIANARGTAWIELTSNGKIDIYAADSISMHTGKDFNITADGDINLTSTGGSINLNASESFFATAGANYEIKAGADGKLTTGGQSNIHAGGQHVETASAIHMNGPGADSAADAPIAPRVPDMEPWDGHENLHDTELTYTTTTDTFMKEKS